MKKNFLIIQLFIFLVPLTLSAQPDTINSYYFNNLKKVISNDPDIISSKYYQERFPNKGGKNIDLFVQTLFVKYKGSSKYFQIGKSFWYSQGKLAYTSNVDLKRKCLTDTAYSYLNDGQVAEIFIYNSKSSKSIPQKIAYNFSTALSGYYVNTPSEYINIGFACGGHKTYEKSYRYCELSATFTLDGMSYTYKPDGSIESAIRYRCNGVVPIINHFNYRNGDIYFSNSEILDSTKTEIEHLLKFKEWMSNNFKSKKDSILLQNNEDGSITYNISQNFKEKLLWDSISSELSFLLKFDTSHKSYKCEITNLKLCNEFFCDKLEYYYVDFLKTKNHEKLLSDIDDRVKKILINIKRHMVENK